MSVRVASPLAAGAVTRLASAVLRAERARVAALSITLVGPARIRSLNREHLGHDWATDVITFGMGTVDGGRGTERGFPSPVPRPPSPVVADIYICPAIAAQNARRHGTTPTSELRRLVIHGVLHALGYDHPDGDDRTASAMWRRQERYLTRLTRQHA